MNDERQQELESHFDNQLSARDRDRVQKSLSDDPAAKRYLDQLRILRSAARLYDPAAQAQFTTITPRRSGFQSVRTFVVAAAACLLVAVWWSWPPESGLTPLAEQKTGPSESPVVQTSVPSPPKSSVVRKQKSYSGDVRLYLLANGELDVTSDVARLVAPTRRSAVRSAAVTEVQALRMANSKPSEQLATRVASARLRETRRRSRFGSIHRSRVHRIHRG